MVDDKDVSLIDALGAPAANAVLYLGLHVAGQWTH